MTMIDQEPERFEDDNGTPEPAPQTQVIDQAPSAAPEFAPLRQAANLVPVKRSGATAMTLGDQITAAQYMAKAAASIPDYLIGNIGDCIALIDIAHRANLSAYMLSQKTYIDPKNKKMNFESQAYHAVLIGSGYLKDAALHVEYEGEDMARTCKVWGTLRGESEPRTLISQPLEKLHPGYTEKTYDGKKVRYVKGSPLWDSKPDIQMFYDTSRDWARMFCPVATLGMLAQYETTEHPIHEAEIITGDGKPLHERLKGADRTEGHQDGHVERELANVASDANAGIKPAKTTEDAPGEAKPAETKRKPGRPKKAAPDEPKRTETLTKTAEITTKAVASQIADRAEAASKARAQTATQQTDAPPPVPANLVGCKTAADYQVYAMAWIDQSGDPEKALERWEAERDARDDLTVRTPTRNALRSRLETKHGV